MNILRLVVAEKEKKNRPQSEEFKALEKAACAKDKGQSPIAIPKEDLKRKLTPTQFRVTQQKGTERPFSGKYLRQKEQGIYVCIVCENPIFASECKYDSHCGWPSFNDVIAQGKVSVAKDGSHGVPRIEITCSQCGAHIGHVFDDGPKPARLRYCANSAALEFKKHTTV